MTELFIALLHHPVLDRRGRIVTSAITSLDIHDLARTGRSYGVRVFYVVHPVREQREFARRLIDHWLTGAGREFDSRRQEALRLVRVVAELEGAVEEAEAIAGLRPLLVSTSARHGGIGFRNLRDRIEWPGAPPVMILFGTGFGLAPSVMERTDLALEPIRGTGDYNHLSVRAAAAAILDRLRGNRLS